MAEEENEVVEESTTITAFDEVSEEPETEEVEATEEKGEAEETEESETETTSETPAQPQHVPIAALTAERRKRQEAAAKLEHYEEIPDPVESPQEYAEFVRNQAQANSLQDRINLSRSIMVDMDPQYEQYEQAFMAEVARTSEDGKIQITNEDLFNQFRESPNPAKFARDMGRDFLLLRERMDPSYEENLRKKWEAERAVVPDLTTATASGSNSDPVENPADLKTIFDKSPL